MNISLIAAMAHHRVMGYQGGMPWHLPAELSYFKQLTIGKTILMGRKTLTSIGRALPKRRNLVLTRQTDCPLPGCEIFHSLTDVWASVSKDEELMVIGGATLYEQTLPLAQRLYLTLIDAQVPGDTYFPAWNPNEWLETSRNEHPADEHNPYSFRTIELIRVERGSGCQA